MERLCVVRDRLTLQNLADDLGVTTRTIARDLQRLRHSGVPISVTPGRHGGASIDRPRQTVTVGLELPEVAALMASLAALGPTASRSAESAMRKLVATFGSD